MDDVKIILSFIWVALMLCFLLGDVMRIFAGDFEPGKLEGKPVSQKVYLGLLIMMVIPILMVVLTLTLDYPINSWVNIIVAIIFFGFNLIGMRGMKIYDKFLIIVSLGFNVLTVWYVFTW